MARRSPSDSGADADPSELSERSSRRAVAGYAAVLLAATALTAAVAATATLVTVVGASLAAFAVGAAAGRVLSRRVPELPIRLGRTRSRRAAVLAPVVPFGVVALAAVLNRVGSDLGLAALASAIAVALGGYFCAELARTRAIAATTADEPIVTSRWQPPRSPTADRLLLVLWALLAGLDAFAGDWFSALVWTGLGLGWAATGVVEGRFRLGETGTDPEIRIYEDGLVKQRPYTAAFVPWDDVDHVRLREGELVLDRGLFDVRFDSDALEAPENVFAAIERRLSVHVVRS